MKTWILILACCALLCAYIGLECGYRRGYEDCRMAMMILLEKPPSIMQVQTGLVNAGYDIGPKGIDGRLADCNTVQAWKKYEIEVLHNQYAAQFMTLSGGKEQI